jgi:hypothetical protein
MPPLEFVNRHPVRGGGPHPASAQGGQHRCGQPRRRIGAERSGHRCRLACLAGSRGSGSRRRGRAWYLMVTSPLETELRLVLRGCQACKRRRLPPDRGTWWAKVGSLPRSTPPRPAFAGLCPTQHIVSESQRATVSRTAGMSSSSPGWTAHICSHAPRTRVGTLDVKSSQRTAEKRRDVEGGERAGKRYN